MLYHLSLGDPSTASATQNAGQGTQDSYFARLIYSYNNKYSVTANIRRDQTSKFAEGHRVGYFPGVSAAWTLTNESFMQPIKKTISSIKIRAGYGEVGNQNVPNYSYGSALRSLFISSSAFGSGLGQYVSNYGNPDVTWEHQKQVNFGLDMLVGKHFDVTVDVYKKISDKFLFADTYPSFTGIGIPNSGTFGIAAPYVNFGKMENKGVDLTLSYQNGSSKTVGFKSTLVMSHYKNTVRELSSVASNISQALSVNGNPTITRTVVGGPVGLFYGYLVNGLYESIDDLNSSPIKSGNIRDAKSGTFLGDIKFKDLNKDGVIDASDRAVIGDPNPDFTFGFTNNISFANFDASLFLTGVYGNDIFNYTRIWGESMTATSGNQMASVANRWTPENTNSVMPRYANGDPNDNARISDRFIEDGSFLRIQNISLGYNLTPLLSSKFRAITRLRTYVSVQNLHTFTNYSGFDPEVGPVNGNIFLSGIDLGRYPVPRTFTFGINAEF
jgi:TonB-linked SusC/RagA family outer membrane protein